VFVALLTIPTVAAVVTWVLVSRSNDRAGHPMRQDTEDAATSLVTATVWAATAYLVMFIGTVLRGGG